MLRLIQADAWYLTHDLFFAKPSSKENALMESIKSKTETPPTETGAGHGAEALAFAKGGLFLSEAELLLRVRGRYAVSPEEGPGAVWRRRDDADDPSKSHGALFVGRD